MTRNISRNDLAVSAWSAPIPREPVLDRRRRHDAAGRSSADPIVQKSSAGIVTKPASITPLKLLIVFLVVFQRFVVPGTPVALVLPVAFVVCGVLLIRGHLRADSLRTGMWLLAVMTCGTAALVSAMYSGRPMSITSLGLLAVMYLPVCFCVSSPLAGRLPELLEFYQRLMIPAGLVCIGQWVAQILGWEFTDLLGWVPSQLLVAKDAFNLSYPIYYGSSIFKSNGIVFLEASFASQFLALAILVQILLGGAVWRIVIFAAALLCSFAGTGMILLGVGLLVIAVRRGGQWATRAGAVAGIAVVVIGLTPAGALLTERANEPGAQGSSGNARFVAPYSLVATAASTEPAELLFGRGPGAVDRDVAFFNPQRIEVSYPVVPKLVGEYGLPATLVFLAFIGTVLVRRVPAPTLSVMALMLYFVLSSALLQPPIVVLVWMLTGLFAVDQSFRTRPVLVIRNSGSGGRP